MLLLHLALLLCLSPQTALRLGSPALHTRSGKSGVVTGFRTHTNSGVTKVKVTFDGDTQLAWQSPENFRAIESPDPKALPLAASLQVEGVTLVPQETVERILVQWDAEMSSQRSTIHDIARSLGLSARLVRLVVHRHGRTLSSGARAYAEGDFEFVRNFLARPQAVKVSVSPSRAIALAASTPPHRPSPPSAGVCKRDGQELLLRAAAAPRARAAGSARSPLAAGWVLPPHRARSDASGDSE